ncbi:MAG: DUF11 domain-containing protein [Bacilli bacterium]|nr:DUF11 domain-containing protein [Bacilli bacterium]
MKKTLFLLLVLLILPLKIFAVVDRQELIFIKTDEQGNFINDAEFKVHSLDGSIEYEVYKTKEGDFVTGKTPTPQLSTKDYKATFMFGETVFLNNGQYYLDYGEENYNKLLSILGPEERQIVEDLKNYNKYDEYYHSFVEHVYSSEYERIQATRGISIHDWNSCSDATPVPQSSTKDYKKAFMLSEGYNGEAIGFCQGIDITIPVLMILEETKAPQGLKKEKAIVEYEYHISYGFSYSGVLVNIAPVNYKPIRLYKYKYDMDYSNMLDLGRRLTLMTNEEELFFKNDCGSYFAPLTNPLRAPNPINSIKKYNVTKLEGEGEGAEEPVCMGYPVIIDHENGAMLTISSYVNNGGSTKAIKGSKINYKVIVTNEGSRESTNNVITSIIPEGFKYVEGSASDNGVYLESANAVRWNVDVIDVESTKELTYKVSVTEDVDLDKAYISTATVMNDASDEIVSNETRVTLESIENPKTGEANKIIVLFVVCVIGLIGYYLIDRKILIKL